MLGIFMQFYPMAGCPKAFEEYVLSPIFDYISLHFPTRFFIGKKV